MADRESTGRCLYCGHRCSGGLTCTYCRHLLWRDPYHLAEGADLLAALGELDLDEHAPAAITEVS